MIETVSDNLQELGTLAPSKIVSHYSTSLTSTSPNTDGEMTTIVKRTGHIVMSDDLRLNARDCGYVGIAPIVAAGYTRESEYRLSADGKELRYRLTDTKDTNARPAIVADKRSVSRSLFPSPTPEPRGIINTFVVQDNTGQWWESNYQSLTQALASSDVFRQHFAGFNVPIHDFAHGIMNALGVRLPVNPDGTRAETRQEYEQRAKAINDQLQAGTITTAESVVQVFAGFPYLSGQCLPIMAIEEHQVPSIFNTIIDYLKEHGISYGPHYFPPA